MGTRSLQLRGALGYAICVKDAIRFKPMLLSMPEKQAVEPWPNDIARTQLRVSSLDADIYVIVLIHIYMHKYIFIVSRIQICPR